ncbi:nucleotidyltransferase family protein [Herbaspirillum sp. AP02]|uniref:nucleotidyltransferase family protein n=1 Tax=unclassified Herbaspirillum TaxID=2624150 RepID=UPI0015DB17AD|nr:MULTISPECIES: nucleotidyltransferase family protein [unclassified Herbaspirillum]MBG7620979.1 nucleotidyltransferase family protein [Herbaspirillum sp. AP02]NZD68442.1 NTP transferase domain-containing protein [Herbaspirillum sp. AP21]
MKAIVLCGGLGTRLGELTRETPKPMIPVAGRPFLSYVLDRLVEGGASELVLAVSFQWEKIRALYGSQWRGVPVAYSVEPQPLGTGGAICHAMRSHDIDETIVVNGDTLLDLDASALVAFARDKEADVAMALKYMADTSRFGRVEIDQSARVLGFREKGVGQAGLINSGVYYVHARVFTASSNAAFSFELDVLTGKLNTAAIYGMQTNAYFIDMGVPEDLARAQYELPLQRPGVDADGLAR